MAAMRTVSLRRSIAAPIDAVFDWLIDGNNWSDIPGMFYSRVRPVDGPEPFGVGSIVNSPARVQRSPKSSQRSNARA